MASGNHTYCAVVALNTYGTILAAKGKYGEACETISEAISSAKSTLDDSKGKSSPLELEHRVTRALRRTLVSNNSIQPDSLKVLTYSTTNGFLTSNYSALRQNEMYMIRVDPDSCLSDTAGQYDLNLESSILLSNLAVCYIYHSVSQEHQAHTHSRTQAVRLLILAQDLIEEVSSKYEEQDEKEHQHMINLLQIEVLIYHTLVPLLRSLERDREAFECELQKAEIEGEIYHLTEENKLFSACCTIATAQAA